MAEKGVGQNNKALEYIAQAQRIEEEQKGRINPSDEHGFYERALTKIRMEDIEGAIADLETAKVISAEHQYLSFHQTIVDLLAEIQVSDHSSVSLPSHRDNVE